MVTLGFAAVCDAVFFCLAARDNYERRSKVHEWNVFLVENFCGVHMDFQVLVHFFLHYGFEKAALGGSMSPRGN